MGILGLPLGYIMYYIFQFVHSYGWALILFILLTRVVLFPLGIKQQKSTARMASFQPKLQKLQKQYAKDKNRLNEETMKLYEQEGVSPTAGCLPMAVQMIFLFGIIDVIYKPLKHLLHVPTELIDAATKLLPKVSSSAELNIIAEVQKGSNLFDSVFTPEMLDNIKSFDMNFLGFNLGLVPNEVWGFLIIIPIVSFVTQILSTILSLRIQQKNGQQMQGGIKWMMLLMPLMSLWFAFTLPAGVGLYWTVSNVFMIIQTVILAKMYPPEKVALMNDKHSEKNREKMRKKREQMEMYTKMQQDGKTSTQAAVATKTAMSSNFEDSSSDKELNKKRIAEARRKMAEKYGDDYKED